MLPLYILVAAASGFWGVSAVLEKKALGKEYASAYLSSFALITAVFSIVLLPFSNFSMSVQSLSLIYIYSVITTFAYLLVARIFRHSNISASSPLFSTLPQVLIVIFAFLILGESLSYFQYLALAILLLAAYFMLFGSRSRAYFQSNKYRIMTVIYSLVFGASAILLKYVLFSVNIFAFLVLSQIFMLINMGVYMQLKYGGIKETASNLRKHSGIIIPISVLTIGYRAFYYAAVSLVAVSIAAPLVNTLYVAITLLAGIFLFKEKDALRKGVLAIVIIAAAYALVS